MLEINDKTMISCIFSQAKVFIDFLGENGQMDIMHIIGHGIQFHKSFKMFFLYTVAKKL